MQVSHGEKPVLIFTTWNSQTRRSTIETCAVHDVSESDRVNITGDYDDGYRMSSKVSAISSDKFYKCKSPFVLFEGDSRDGVTTVAISSSLRKELMCSGHYDCVIRVWDINDRQLLHCLEGHTDFVVSVAIWREKEPILVSGSSDGTIKVWDLHNYSLITTCEGHTRDVWSVSTTVGPDPLIVSASADRSVRLWDVNNVLTEIKWNRQRSFLTYLKKEFNACSEAVAWVEAYENALTSSRSSTSTKSDNNIDRAYTYTHNNEDNYKNDNNKDNNDNNNDNNTDNNNDNNNSSSDNTANNKNKNRRLTLQSQNLCIEILSYL